MDGTHNEVVGSDGKNSTAMDAIIDIWLDDHKQCVVGIAAVKRKLYRMETESQTFLFAYGVTIGIVLYLYDRGQFDYHLDQRDADECQSK